MTSIAPIVTLAAAESFLYERLNFEKSRSTEQYPFRLDRMRSLIAAAGRDHWLFDPATTAATPPSECLPTSECHPPAERHPPIVHIAGTKGKGSTTTILQSILTAAGHTVGTYTSPHLDRLTDRFRIDGTPVGDDSLIAAVDHLAQASRSVASADQITFFELTTAAAIEIFIRHRCDVVILETGLGGRLDSTNVFDANVAAITTIGLDHQQILGDDHASIAAEKAGIIKPGRPVYCSVRHPDADKVIGAFAAKNNSPLQKIDRDWNVQIVPHDDWGSHLSVEHLASRRRIDASLAIEGEHQGTNASLATAIAIDAFDVNDQAIRIGLAAPGPPARLERFAAGREHVLLLDSAHNPDSIDALCNVLIRRVKNASLSIVFATSLDKDAAAMLAKLSPIADQLFLTAFKDNPRRVDPQHLREKIVDRDRKKNQSIETLDDADDALVVALEQTPPGGWIVICGSFFLAAQLRPRCQRIAKGFSPAPKNFSPVQPGASG